ncbi:hypothetical protein KIN20_001205 [Parelaphostrongylus tenuis]|uniref:Uncharacterized protein n=1 Tax=Parelaphostrongylus tenuis TaxID=148309 RepID=A0AAD5MEW4_PARTN|nr:hypothetical protein KIN20_001205 [Parelaphostrongylus tenuis]
MGEDCAWIRSKNRVGDRRQVTGDNKVETSNIVGDCARVGVMGQQESMLTINRRKRSDSQNGFKPSFLHTSARRVAAKRQVSFAYCYAENPHAESKPSWIKRRFHECSEKSD